MAAAGIVFGAHGVSHRLMSQLSDEEQEAEAMGSRRAEIEARLGYTPRAFCYPNGDWDYRAAITP